MLSYPGRYLLNNTSISITGKTIPSAFEGLPLLRILPRPRASLEVYPANRDPGTHPRSNQGYSTLVARLWLSTYELLRCCGTREPLDVNVQLTKVPQLCGRKSHLRKLGR